MKLPSAQLVVSLTLIGLFGAAYFRNPENELLLGALIAGFAAAYGYWLGSSSGSKQNGDVVRRIAEQPSVTAAGDHATINGPTVAPAERSLEDPA